MPNLLTLGSATKAHDRPHSARAAAELDRLVVDLNRELPGRRQAQHSREVTAHRLRSDVREVLECRQQEPERLAGARLGHRDQIAGPTVLRGAAASDRPTHRLNGGRREEARFCERRRHLCEWYVLKPSDRIALDPRRKPMMVMLCLLYSLGVTGPRLWLRLPSVPWRQWRRHCPPVAFVRWRGARVLQRKSQWVVVGLHKLLSAASMLLVLGRFRAFRPLHLSSL